MADPCSFLEKVRRLQPPADLKFGTYFVAVLRHHHLPTDDLEQADLLWVKCPGTKRCKAVLKAYNLTNNGPLQFVLRHDFQVISNATYVRDLAMPGDQLIVVEAVDEMMPRPNPNFGRTPLQDVTNKSRQNTTSHEKEDKAFARENIKQESKPLAQVYEPFVPSIPEINQQKRIASPILPFTTNEDSVDPGVLPETKEQQEEPARLNILELFSGHTPEELEKGVEKGVEVLKDLRNHLESQPSNDATQWLVNIENVQKQAVRTKTIVGVVGATGAGKSSVINAMLDEERLVPTNCMRACTAVVTEISYNHDESVRYKAEIDFISRDDWRKELKTLFQDLFDGNGNVSRECANEESEAGIAYAKLKAVYPQLTKEDMTNTSVEKLMAHDNVNLLGTQRGIQHDDSLMFYKKLQFFVDSKEKSGTKSKSNDDHDGNGSDKTKKKQRREMEYWPLIRVVRLYVRAKALITGATIVDLPGVHDSNQARAAVAQGYLKQCTGLWIVAPITRAVDDKSAKTLLGDSFKRQLKMDGGYNSVTFICSKTDDISLTEAQDSLGLEDEMGGMYARSDELRKSKKAVQGMINDFKGTKSDYTAAMDAADEELEVWEKLQEDLGDGKTVYGPRATGANKKRKRGGGENGQRKKSKYTEDDSDNDFVAEDSDNNDSEDAETHSEADESREPLTESGITDKITELKTTKKEGRRQRAQLDDKIKNLRAEIETFDKEQEEIDAELSAKCISGRNEYSRTAIQQDFAAGIRELDQELAEEEDAAEFNPEVDARDYDEVARSLPVFCVSSRGYQKLKGRLQKDKGVYGFKHIDETEIPLLQNHARKLTEAGRQEACRRFLNNFSQLLNSLKLWSLSDGTGKNMTHGQLQRESQILKEKLNKLDMALEKAIKGVISTFSEELQDNVYDHFDAATSAAQAQANETSRKWGAPVNREDRGAGGLYWSSYKAVVRRDGVFSNAQGLHDFNEQLTEPIIKHISSGWEKSFSRRLPSVMAGIATVGAQVLNNFHRDIEKRAIRNGASVAGFQMLKQQLLTYREFLKDASGAAKTSIIEQQKEVNRQFVPKITNAMLEVYAECVAESGRGQFVRMKTRMDHHVEQAKLSMFQDSVDTVRTSLKKMLKGTEDLLLGKVDELFNVVQRDYTAVLVGQGAVSDQLPREQRLLRREVHEVVEGTEMIFRRVVGLEAEEESKEDVKKGAEKDAEMQAYSSEAVQDDDAAEGQSIKQEPTEDSAMPDTVMTGDQEHALVGKPGMVKRSQSPNDGIEPKAATTLPSIQSETETSLNTTDPVI